MCGSHHATIHDLCSRSLKSARSSEAGRLGRLQPTPNSDLWTTYYGVWGAQFWLQTNLLWIQRFIKIFSISSSHQLALAVRSGLGAKVSRTATHWAVITRWSSIVNDINEATPHPWLPHLWFASDVRDLTGTNVDPPSCTSITFHLLYLTAERRDCLVYII